ncbi:MAG: 23S rRNA (adenine(2503)-C(2))-methyltransferase RlmN [Elusimicrobia bacterium]|nr:23S rRNA (adenine(2503)-C(2))-methyltransferase RlmN [Elusimicrobiota bacterium]
MDILSLSVEELSAHLVGEGHPAYRARQVFEWIYHKQIVDPTLMTSLPKPLRDLLGGHLPFPVLIEGQRQVSRDGTIKFLWELSDGQRIESVFIPMRGHATLCISSQAGCKFGCGFCASGLGGWKRNLSTGEIIAQVLQAMRAVRPQIITHIVFMGVGEPFDNAENVFKAVRILNAPEAFGIAARRITISTCGVVPGIKAMAQSGLQLELSVSLHASNDRLRSCLMPVNKKYPLKDLIAACREYALKTRRQVTFEYIGIRDLTCTPRAAQELSGLLQGWLCKVNLIPYNPVAEFPFQPAAEEERTGFERALRSAGVPVTHRTPRGRDISAACGQLRHGLQKRGRVG